MILGIESSCDESALAVFDSAGGLLVDLVYSQIQTHQKYGGIVPDLASREHLEAFVPLLNQLKTQVDLEALSSVAVTTGPGLASCLALGLALGRSLSLALDLPLVGVNHLRGHVFSPFLPLHAEAPDRFDQEFQKLLPHLGLIVSGGNTVLFEITTDHDVVILGETVDDAAGEALDKGAKLLGMPYPGGPLIEKAAKGGRPDRFDFPRGMVQSSEVKFSFSGLKTSLRYRLEKLSDEQLDADLSDLCASYQQAVVDALSLKTKSVLKRGRYKSLGLSGGVANNRTLRHAFLETAKKANLPLLIAEKHQTGDNAGMIAFAAFCDPAGTVPNENGLSIQPSWKLVS
ncbi:MAG: tRNA (adenosine(37)-N6)-threonylcarbamoyltransferase complex transferase subunit TsaD [Verrucomicrobia bacterium]|nr:tRNA (adenosine(37)-N6)-threonylcarbamoyltransferase complex transferase subunit TsaD [Verrucomicrobiota bacterium]